MDCDVLIEYVEDAIKARREEATVSNSEVRGSSQGHQVGTNAVDDIGNSVIRDWDLVVHQLADLDVGVGSLAHGDALVDSGTTSRATRHSIDTTASLISVLDR